MDIEPRFNNLGPAIARGLVGHAALDSFYTAKQQGYSHDDCVEAAWATISDKLSWIVTEWPEDLDLIKVIAKTKDLLSYYFTVFKDDDFKIHAVEKFYTAPITESDAYGMRLDLLIEMMSGPYRGDFLVVDNKFVYNFKTSKQLAMDGQLPKYVKTLQKNGIIVTKGMFNQIRYRELKNPSFSDMFQRTIVKASKTKTDNIWKEQRKCTTEISKIKSLPLIEQSELATRNLSPFTCKYCHFQELCNSELEEQDISTALVANFQPNTYGYTDVILEE